MRPRFGSPVRSIHTRCVLLGRIALTLLAIVGEPCRAQDSADVAKVVVPFVQKHYVRCHGAEKPKAALSLHRFKDSKAILKERRLWDAAFHLIESGEMPPAKQPQPTADEKKAFATLPDGRKINGTGDLNQESAARG